MKKCKCSDRKIYDVSVDQGCRSFCINIGTTGGSNISKYIDYTPIYNTNIAVRGTEEINSYKEQQNKDFENYSKVIKQFVIDDSDIIASGETREYFIKGTPGSVFSLTIENEDPSFYNFKTKSFDSTESNNTKLKKVKIPNSGVYSGFIVFPSVSDNDFYKISLIAHPENSTSINGILFNINRTIYQYTNTTVTFDGFTTSSSYSSTGSTTITSPASDNTKNGFSVSMNLTLSGDSMAIKRQPIPQDFEVKITKTVVESSEMPHRNTSGSDFFRYLYTDVSKLSVGGRAVAGARISAGTVIPIDSSQFVGSVGDDFDGGFSEKDAEKNPPIDTSAKTIILSTKSQLPGSTNVDFYYPITNSSQTEAIVDSVFQIDNINLSLDSTTTTTTASTVGSSTTAIAVSSANGIEKHVTTTVNGTVTNSNRVIVASATGIYVGQTLYDAGSSSLTNNLPLVTAVNGTIITLSTPQSLGNGHTLSFSNSIVNSNNMVTSSDLNFVPIINIVGSTIYANTAQELENGETVTITKTGRNATLTFDVKFNKVGSSDFTIYPNLDNFIEII